MATVVTLGETMALFTGAEPGPLRHATALRLSAVGSESNVAIGLRRLGTSAAWLGVVGDDEMGRLVLNRLRGEDVDVSGVRVDPDAPTGLMLKEHRTGSATRVSYYRRGSAGSRLTADDLPEDVIAQAKVLHVTGVTAALGATAREAVLRAVEMARVHQVTVSLDYNYRAALWTPEQARPVLTALTRAADVVFAGDDEAAIVTGEGYPAHALALRLRALGPAQVVIKRAAAGATAAVGDQVIDVPAVEVDVVDPVGAGDAFVAGYLHGLVTGRGVRGCVELGCLTGAFAVTSAGDWEGLPSMAELALLATPGGTVLR